MAQQAMVFDLELIALNPRIIKGRIPGVRRKPKHPILRFDDRVTWIAEVLGWPRVEVARILNSEAVV